MPKHLPTVSHRRALLCAATFATLAAAGPAAAIDPFFPTFGNNGYDVGHYDLTLDATDPANLIGKAKLKITAEQKLETFKLDLEHLQVTTVAIGGKVATFSQTEHKLTIQPKDLIRKGDIFTVVIEYHGDPKPLADPTAPDDPDILPLGWLTYGKTSFALSEPVGASSFFPCNDEPTDKAGFSFHVTVKKPFTAVANGVLADVEDLGSAQRFHWKQSQPMTTWLATVQINDKYTLTRQTAGDIPLRYYTTPLTSQESIDVFKETPKMIKYFESIVGPYPFGGYGSVVVDDPELYYALETQAMSTFPSSFIDIGVVAHELAHQWFGNAVSVEQWKDLWLAEGFATYLEFLYPNRDDPATFDAIMRSIYAYVDENKIGPAVVSRAEDIFADNTYYRGALALYALRLKVGEKTFYRTLRAWYLTYRYKNANSHDFIDVAVETSHDPSVRPLMNAWIFQKEVPPLPDGDVVASGEKARMDTGVIAEHIAARRHRAARR